MMRRYEAYYAMYTQLSGLRADVYAVLDIRANGEDEVNRLDDFVGTSLYDYAMFLVLKADFTKNFGGIWMFGQADIEQAVADSIKLIEHFSPLPVRRESLVRIRVVDNYELHPFLWSLESDSEGRAVLAAWQRRILSCSCDLAAPPSAQCKVHAMMRACEFYEDTLDTDWYRTIPWHGDPPPNVGSVDPATLYHDLGFPDS